MQNLPNLPRQRLLPTNEVVSGQAQMIDKVGTAKGKILTTMAILFWRYWSYSASLLFRMFLVMFEVHFDPLMVRNINFFLDGLVIKTRVVDQTKRAFSPAGKSTHYKINPYYQNYPAPAGNARGGGNLRGCPPPPRATPRYTPRTPRGQGNGYFK